MKIVAVPASLEERTFDQLLQPMAEAGGSGEKRTLFDARRLRWVDPYGMLGLLGAGQVAARARPGERPLLHLPESPEVGSYLARMGFMRQAESIFELHGATRRPQDGASDVLLEITPVNSHADVHEVVERVQGAATVILARQLGYPASAVVQFSVILSEVCQNILEHADAGGWVAAQTYNWARRLGRKVAVIAVMDLGVGFRGSLARTHAARYGDRWGDATALEAAFLHGITRFPDPGRGQGLQQIRKQVGRWGGRMSIRSGTAEIADIPDWDDTPPLEENLPPFPGAQICIVLPQRVEEESAAPPAGTRGSGGAQRVSGRDGERGGGHAPGGGYGSSPRRRG